MSKSLNAGAAHVRVTRVLIGVAGVTLVGGGGVVALLNNQLRSLRAVVQNREAQVGSAEQVARRYQATLDSYNDTARRLQFLETSVTAKSYVPTLLQQLQTLAAANHLTVQAVRPSQAAPPAPAPKSDGPSGAAAGGNDAKKAPAYDSIDLQADVTGTYANTVTFLYGLTRFPKIISVASVSLHPAAPTAGAAGPAQVTANLHLTAFAFHDDGLPAPAGPATAASATPAVSTPATSVAGAAGHAAAAAVGADRAARERGAVGVSTL